MKQEQHLRKENKKAQVIIYDFLAAFVIFVVVVLVVALLWFRTSAQIENDRTAEEKLRIARDVSYILIKTEGHPLQWEKYHTTICLNENCSPGLAIDDNVVSQEKIDAFLLMSKNTSGGADYGYNRTREMFNIEGYDFYFQYRDKYGNLLNSTGKNPYENLSINIKRAVMLNNAERIIEFSIY